MERDDDFYKMKFTKGYFVNKMGQKTTIITA